MAGERPETWVTHRTGHMDDTFSLVREEAYALEECPALDDTDSADATMRVGLVQHDVDLYLFCFLLFLLIRMV
jgi:hypothetical protein